MPRARRDEPGEEMLFEDDPWEARWTRGFEDAGVEELRLRRGAPVAPKRRREDRQLPKDSARRSWFASWLGLGQEARPSR